MATRGLVRPSRRAVLVLGATSPLAACALFEADPPADPVPSPPHPDDVVREDAVAAERRLLDHYAAVAAAHPALAPGLAPFVERHERHVAALLATAAPAESGAPSPPSEPSEPHPAAEPPVPAAPEDAIAELRDAESAAVQERLDACLATHDGALARMLAGIAACEATHDRLLRGVRG